MRRPTLFAPVVLAAFAPAAARAQPDCSFQTYQACMAAAEKSLRLSETRELRRWLDACDPRLRGWEWDHLDAITDTSASRASMPGTPIRIAMPPSGDRIAVVADARVHVLSWPALQALAVLEGHGDAVYRAEWSADGDRLITVSRDVTSRTWDASSGAEIARITLANPAFAAAAFDPAGKTAATCAWERDESGRVHGVVWVWDPATGEVRHRTRVGVKPLSSIRFDAGGSRILAGSWDGLVHVLDPAGGEIRRLALPDEGVYNAVNDVALSPDSRFAAAASKDGTTRVFDLDSGELVASLRGHGGYVEGVAFSPDGMLLATCSADATIAVWRTGDWTRRNVLRGASDTVRGVVWTAGGASLVGCSLDGHLLSFDPSADDDATSEIRTGTEGIYSTSMSPDGGAVAVACHDGWMRVFCSKSGALLLEWEAHPGSTCHAAAWGRDGRRLVTASWDHTARVWDPGNGREIAVLDAHKGVYAAAISPDGTRAATSGGTVLLWDVDRAQPLHTISIDGAEPARIEFSSDGALLASAWSDGFARIHRTSDGALVAVLGTGKAGVQAVAFLPGDAKVASGDDAGVVRVYPAGGGEPELEIDTGGRGVNHVACCGDRIAVATDQVWLIDAEHRGTVLGLAPHADSIWHLSWSADGRRLATCDTGGIIKILER